MYRSNRMVHTSWKKLNNVDWINETISILFWKELVQALSIRISNSCPGSPRIVYVCLPGNSHKSDSCDPRGYVVPTYNTASAWLHCFSWQHFLSPALLLVTMAQGSMIESYCIDSLSLVPVPGQVCVRESWGCWRSLPAYLAGWTFLTRLQTDQHQNHFLTVLLHWVT